MRLAFNLLAPVLGPKHAWHPRIPPALDEPTEGVWVGVIEEIADRLKQLSREMFLILLEQHIELALDVAHHAYVMDRGHIALDGPAQATKTDPQLMRHLAP